MARRFALFLGVIVVISAGTAAVPASEGPGEPEGDYLGQQPPGLMPELFGPGVVSTGLAERDLAITPDGNEIYFSVVAPAHGTATIMVIRRVEGRWGAPEPASFSGAPGYLDMEPAISSDGARLFFLSNRPTEPGAEPNEDIWVVERTPAGWSEPRNLGTPINTPQAEYFPSVTNDGTLYFSRREPEGRVEYIYRSRLVDGRYQEPERLPEQVNAGTARFNAFVAPDESYIVLSIVGRSDAISPADYYVVFAATDGAWHEPVNLGNPINLPRVLGFSPYVSRDGRYFFLMSQRPAGVLPDGRLTYADYQRLARGPGNGLSDIWWVDAKVITGLAPR